MKTVKPTPPSPVSRAPHALTDEERLIVRRAAEIAARFGI
jgi:hypothetical protein